MDTEIKFSERVDVESKPEIENFGTEGRRAKTIFDQSEVLFFDRPRKKYLKKRTALLQS